MKLHRVLGTAALLATLFSASVATSETSEAKILAILTAKLESLQKNLVPAGTVVAYTGTVAPRGWILCNGSGLTRSQYPELFKVLGYSHGGSGETFNIPDYRGLFLRGVDMGRGMDPDAAARTPMAAGGGAGNTVGSIQLSANLSHNHSGATAGMNGITTHSHATNGITWSSIQSLLGGGVWPTPVYVSADPQTAATDINHTHNFTTGTSGGKESRPSNAYVNYIIKY